MTIKCQLCWAWLAGKSTLCWGIFLHHRSQLQSPFNRLIVTTLQEHLSPKPFEIAETFRFYKRNQHEGESILSYVAKLRKLVTLCNFGWNLNAAPPFLWSRSQTWLSVAYLTHRPTEGYQNSSDTKQQPCHPDSELPIQVESREDPVSEVSEQPATWRLMFCHQVQWLTLHPAVHQIWVSLFLNILISCLWLEGCFPQVSNSLEQ